MRIAYAIQTLVLTSCSTHFCRRQDRIRERRERVIAKRKEKRDEETRKMEERRLSHEEKVEKWEKEKAEREQLKKDKKVSLMMQGQPISFTSLQRLHIAYRQVKDKVYNNLARLDDEKALLDIPFAA